MDLPAFNKLKIINIFLIFLTALYASMIIQRETNSSICSLIGYSTIIYSGAFLYSSKQFLSEIPVSLLLLIFSAQFFKNWTEKGTFFYVRWAMCMVGIIFMKAAFLYALLPLFLYFFFIFLQNKNFVFLKKIIIFNIVVLLLSSLWMARNYSLGAGFVMAGRKDEMLYNRAIYDTIRKDEYPFTYILWTPGLRKFFLTEKNKSSWERLWNWRGNDEVFLLAYDFVDGVVRKQYPVLPNGSFPRISSEIIEADAWIKIKENIPMHLKISLAFLYRSLFPEDGSGLEYFGIKPDREPDYDKRVDSLILGIICNIPFWVAFFYLLIFNFFQKNYKKIGFFIFPIYLAILLSLIGFSHFRFMYPMIPILCTCFSLVLNSQMKKLFKFS